MIKKIDIMGIGLDNYTVRESMRQVENYLSNDVLNTIENISMQMLIASETDPVVHNVISELDLSVIGEKEILKAAAVNQAAGVSGAAGAGNSNGAGNTSGTGAADTGSALKKSIVKGMSQAAADAAKLALKDTDALELINTDMIPALDEVGKGFEAGTVFLPQLLMSAEAAKAAFAVVKESMEASGEVQEKKGKVILATVKGDIHDIGKNIVKVLLENYSFDVMDLGRDVPPETIVEAAVKEHVPVVGLSALMTTTVPAMEDTIKALRKDAPWVKVMVGGAVLTREYADAIGADAYCKDAMASVNFATSVIGEA